MKRRFDLSSTVGLRGLIAGTASAVAITSIIVACVGDEADATTTPPSSSSGGDASPQPPAEDGGLEIAPDAEPPRGCPLGCLPPPPDGWNGPNAVYDGPTATLPTGCLEPYNQPVVANAHQHPVQDPATCTCGEAKVVGTAECSITVQSFTDNGCTADAGTHVEVLAGGAKLGCVDLAAGGTSMKVQTPTLTKVPACTFPDQAQVKPPIAFEKENVACALPQVGICEGRSDCTASPLPSPPFGRLCIHKDGSNRLCPSFDYPVRFAAFRRVDDNRECTCSAIPNVKCGNKFQYSDAGACGNVDAGPLDTCLPKAGSVLVRDLQPGNVNCKSEKSIDGGIDGADGITFCCSR